MNIKKKRSLIFLFVTLMSLSLLVACGNGEEEKKEVEETKGLVYEGSLELDYASSFEVDYYEGGYKIVSDWEGRKTLLVPEGKDEPEEMEEVVDDVVFLSIDNIGAFSTVIATELRPIDSLDKIKLVTTEADRWHIEKIKEGLESEDIIYVGKNSAPDFELIEKGEPDLIILTTGTSHGENKITLKLDEMGINWISHATQRENDPRARLEWVKFMGGLLDKEDEAKEFFDEQVAKIDKIMNEGEYIKEEDKVTVATTFMSKDTFYVRNAGDYQVKMLEMAGGKYVLEDLEPEENGNTKMTAEEFYTRVEDVDFLIYDTSMGRDIQSVSDLVEHAEYLGDIKAVKNGNVWGVKAHYWQSSDNVADMIADLQQIINSEPGEITETEYYFILPE